MKSRQHNYNTKQNIISYDLYIIIFKSPCNLRFLRVSLIMVIDKETQLVSFPERYITGEMCC